MYHPLFPSVDELLDPNTVSALGKVPVSDVRCVPVQQAEANSGSRFYQVETNEGIGPRYFLKCTSPAAYLPPSYNDPNHSVAAWQHGILDRLPLSIDHAIVACARDGAGYAILMHDVRKALMPGDIRFSLADHALFLNTMVAMHATFWEDPALKDSPLGDGHSEYFLIESAAEGWGFMEEFLEPDAAQIVRSLLQNPQPLNQALMRYPATLVHNDLWWANLGIVRGDDVRIVVLDWDFAMFAPPAIDLAHYIGENAGLLPASAEAVIAAYRAHLAQNIGDHFDDRWWLPQLDLCFLGDFLRRGKWLLHAMRQPIGEQERAQYFHKLAWWSGAIRRGAQWLERRT
jgi:hypothetical protein